MSEPEKQVVVRIATGDHAQRWLLAAVFDLAKSPADLRAGGQQLARFIKTHSNFTFWEAFADEVFEIGRPIAPCVHCKENRWYSTWTCGGCGERKA